MSQKVKVGILKAGCLGSLPLIEFLIDERADRTDVDVLVVGSGAKLGLKECKLITKWLISQKPDFIVFIGPAQSAPGPTKARQLLVKSGIPSLVISDGPAQKITKELEATGLGYIIIDVDAMIGARREFLDPIEMVLYNSDMIKILAITGVLQIIIRELDHLIWAIEKQKRFELPRLLVHKEMAIESSGLHNPYAKAKAMAAYAIAKSVARVNSEACSKIKEWKQYIPLVASGHEMIRIAAKLVDRAREIEKTNNAVLRKPHYNDGSLGIKKKLIEKPQRIEKGEKA